MVAEGTGEQDTYLVAHVLGNGALTVVRMALGARPIATFEMHDTASGSAYTINSIACYITSTHMLLACESVPNMNLHGRDLRKAVDGLVGRVNGKYGKTDYCPIQYVKKKLQHR